MRGIHRSPVNFPHKGQWRGALMFSLICARINGWVNNREAGDLRRHCSHYKVNVMAILHTLGWVPAGRHWPAYVIMMVADIMAPSVATILTLQWLKDIIIPMHYITRNTYCVTVMKQAMPERVGKVDNHSVCLLLASSPCHNDNVLYFVASWWSRPVSSTC